MTQPMFDDKRLDAARLAIDDSAIDDASNLRGESDLRTIVSMLTLTRLIQRKKADASDAIEYEYRDAEYEDEENRIAES